MNQFQDIAERTYQSLEEAREAVNRQSQDEGFIFTSRRTRRVGHRPDGEIKAVCLKCSCSGKSNPVQQQQRKRVRGSRLTGCQSALTIRRMRGEEDLFHWVIEVDQQEHNHEPFADPAVHPQGRALDTVGRQQILTYCRSRLSPLRIVSAMRNNNVTVTPRDVYNIRDAERRRLLAGRTPLVALLDGLESAALGAPYFTQFDDERRLSHLFIVSPSAREICCRFSAGKVWLLDSTYKTNRFGLPLLHLVGVTATSQTFTFAYVFMAGERTEDYLWAVRLRRQVFVDFSVSPITFVTDRELALMNALDGVFPDANNLQCRLHISKNILAKQRRTFESVEEVKEFTQQWNALLQSPTVTIYQQRLADMREAFPNQVMVYLEETWLYYREKNVDAFLRGKLHFRHTTTSRVESAHSALKKWIAVSTGDLLTVDSACRLACYGQLAAIKLQTAQERAVADMQFGQTFSGVMGKVSVVALKSAFRQYKDRNNVGDCHGIFTSSIM